MTPEAKTQKRIVDALETLGCHVSKFDQGRRTRQTPGIPDLLVMHPDWGISCWVEVKRPDGGRLRGSQKAWHAIARQSGQRVIVARGVDEVVEALESHGAPIST